MNVREVEDKDIFFLSMIKKKTKSDEGRGGAYPLGNAVLSVMMPYFPY